MGGSEVSWPNQYGAGEINIYFNCTAETLPHLGSHSQWSLRRRLLDLHINPLKERSQTKVESGVLCSVIIIITCLNRIGKKSCRLKPPFAFVSVSSSASLFSLFRLQPHYKAHKSFRVTVSKVLCAAFCAWLRSLFLLGVCGRGLLILKFIKMYTFFIHTL
jgi:hypothetical protein